MTTAQIQRALSRKLLRGGHTRTMMAYYREKLPELAQPATEAEWTSRVARIRKALLDEVYLKGHQPGIQEGPPKVEWCGVIRTGKGYRIRKLRYEGYPGMWIPALLYEPTPLRGKVPAVLNPNGHHRGGKAMPYKQARCINLAKRGMLALSTEFVGMGELQGSANHMQQGHIDLCGTAGVGVMYLAMKRGLDVLLSHRNADPERVAMTGLSGGGWQTAVLSAIDERIKAVLPVSGHSPIWHRATRRWADHGDVEQTPTDLCTVADYDTLTAMFAPRPALLIHSAKDSIFRPEHMRPAIYRPARKVYRLLDIPDRIGFYANEEPGTHNYDRDIREQLYRFLKEAWDLDIPTEDIPCDGEIRSEWELTVGLPPDNPTVMSIARDLAGNLPAQRASKATRTEDRRRLRSVLRLPRQEKARAADVGKPVSIGATKVRHHVLEIGRWRLPVTALAGRRSGDPVVVLNDGGKARSASAVEAALTEGRQAYAADLLAFGEQVVGKGEYHPYFMECIAAAGDRPLGICVSQLLSLLEWIGSVTPGRKVEVRASGLSNSVIALCAAALKPAGIARMRVELPDTFRRLMDWQVDYVANPVVFCFGLLKAFDIEDLITLSDPVEMEIEGRGPMR